MFSFIWDVLEKFGGGVEDMFGCISTGIGKLFGGVQRNHDSSSHRKSYVTTYETLDSNMFFMRVAPVTLGDSRGRVT